MFVKRLNKNHFDVFLGNGWDQWMRVRLNHWGVVQVGGSIQMNRDTKHELNQRLLRK